MQKVDTMEELHFTRDALKSSRLLLSLDATFVTYGEGHELQGNLDCKRVWVGADAQRVP